MKRITMQLFAGILACMLFIAPRAQAGYYPIKLVNHTANTKKGIHPYIIFMAQDTTAAANYCVLQLTYNATANAQVASLVPIQQSTDSRLFTYRIDSLQGYDTAKQAVNILIPNTISGRCMVSLNYPLYMPAIPSDTGSHQWVFQNPSVSNTADVNYDIIYDKFEFTYNQKGVFYIDPTAVDFFAIPVTLKNGSTSSGAPAHVKRDKLIKTITKTLNDGIDNEWNTLVIKDSGTIMRITAPNLAPAFDTGYLTQSGFNYIDSLVKYYQSHILKINCSELDVAGDEVYDKYGVMPAQDADAYIFTSQPIVNGLWIFSNDPADTSLVPIVDTIDMNTAVSDNFFGPGTAPFITPNKTVISIIVKNITAAFTVGLLPAPDSMMLDSSYLSNTVKYPYYQNDTLLHAPNGTGPWYNLYTKALHKAIPQIYAFAYDDVLGQSGTLVSSNNADTITVTLGDMGNVHIPYHSNLLPVYANTLTYNSGFVKSGNWYVDTLKWTVAANQPPNAQYFFMGSGPDFTITPEDFLSYQYGNFFSSADTMGWVRIPDSLLSGGCTNTMIPMSVNTCGGPSTPCPTGSNNWKLWRNAPASALLPIGDSAVFPVTVTSFTGLTPAGGSYMGTVNWSVPPNQPSTAKYFILAGGAGYTGTPTSLVAAQAGSFYTATDTTGTITIPAANIDTSKTGSIQVQVFTCGGPGHPCPTAANLTVWSCDEGSVPYPQLSQKSKAKKK